MPGLSELQPAAAAVKNLGMLGSQLCVCWLQSAAVCKSYLTQPSDIAAILLTHSTIGHRPSSLLVFFISFDAQHSERKRGEHGKQRRAPGGTHFTTTTRIQLSVWVAEAKEQGTRHRFHLEVWNTWIPECPNPGRDNYKMRRRSASAVSVGDSCKKFVSV